MPDHPPKVLVVSSFFPPLSSAGGSIRLVKFIRYLSELGWKFVVFTQDPRQAVVPQPLLSRFLLDELPKEVVVNRVAAPFSKRDGGRKSGILSSRMLGDSSLGWGLRVFWTGLSDLDDSDLVLGETPPFTNALIAWLLSFVGRKPLILDLKDDWVGSQRFLQKGKLQQKIEIFLEHLIVRSASAVITVTPQSDQLYQDRYSYLRTPGKFHLIPNGCDLDEYEMLNNREKKIASTRFLILSAAWGYRKDYRDISPFLRGLHIFFKRRPEARNKVDVVLLGDSLSSDYDEVLSELNIKSVVWSIGAVQRNDLVEWLWKADLLFLVQPAGNTTAISGTLYEYWATGKAPVLLISESGAPSELVEANHFGKHFHFDQVEQIADYIEVIFKAYQDDNPVWIERDGIQAFNRRILAKQMNDIWQSLIIEGQ